MNEGLLRQRRNLIAVCILLWFMKYGNVQFTKINFVGFEVDVNNSQVVILSLWIAFAYFLFRYYQYFVAHGLPEVQKVFSLRLDEKCEPVLDAIVKQHYPKEWLEKRLEVGTIAGMVSYDFTSLKRNNWRVTTNKVAGSDTVNLDMPISRWIIKRPITQAIVSATLRDSVVTDYILPLILADWVLYYCGANDWNGGLMNFVF